MKSNKNKKSGSDGGGGDPGSSSSSSGGCGGGGGGGGGGDGSGGGGGGMPKNTKAALTTGHPAWLDTEPAPSSLYISHPYLIPTSRNFCWMQPALHRHTKGRFMLKHLPLQKDWNIAMCNGEFRAHVRAAGVKHVVSLSDAFVLGRSLVLVFPLLDSVSFADYDNCKSVQEDFWQLCLGLASLHSAGLARGDISPNNTMRDPATGNLVWIDLGFARFVPSTAPRPYCGTPGFMSPDNSADCLLGTEPNRYFLQIANGAL